jgi:hypothetical protein
MHPHRSHNPHRSFRSLAAVAAALCAAFLLAGCFSDPVPQYQSLIYYEAAPNTNAVPKFIVNLPLQNRSYEVISRPIITDDFFADVVAVRVKPDPRGANGFIYEPLKKPGTAPAGAAPGTAQVPPPPALYSPDGTPARPVALAATPATTASATIVPSAAPAKPAALDFSFPALLVRLNDQGRRAFYNDSLQFRTRNVFLAVNGRIIGAVLISSPVRTGYIHFHPQLPLRPGETQDDLEARLIKLERDINESLLLLKKAEEKAAGK